ncbi:unnamed protein product [Tilletia controversa]|nr:unnamed protein product [Tilletia controversa]
MASFHLPGKQQEQPASASASSSSSTPKLEQQERAGNGPMMFLGQQCSWHECNREDFLPFQCADCSQPYCATHFRPYQHACAHAAAHEAEEDFRVPLCPICNEPPRDWRRGEDPNIAMERHLSSGMCAALDAGGLLREGSGVLKSAGSGTKARTKKANECQFHRCHKIMIVPMHCAACSSDFCPSHRAPIQHACANKDKPNGGNGNGSAKPSPLASQRADIESGIRAARGAFLKKLSNSIPSSTSPSSSSSSASNQTKSPTPGVVKSAPPPAAPVEPSKASESSSPSTSTTTNGATKAGAGGIIGGGLFKTKAERYVDVNPSSSSSEVETGAAGGGNRDGGASGEAGQEAQGDRVEEEEAAAKQKNTSWSPFLIPTVTSFAPPALFVPSPRA